MNHPVVEALGWSIIHSLWECCIVALLFTVFYLLIRSANARYAAGCTALLLMLAAAAVTFLSIFEQTESVAALADSGSISDAMPQNAPPFMTVVPHSGAPSFLAITVWLWITGVIAMTGWSAAGWISAQRLKRHSKQAIAGIWQQRLAALAARIHVHRTILLCESVLAQVPAVIGWLRPVILVPAGALINLSAQELEAVLAHELAHIRRHDYLVNLLQTAIETLLFYHPAVWWIGRHVRAEREHCCDDLAVKACGDRLVYARALTSLEELRCGNPQFAMAASGGELSGRIRRLFGTRQPARRLLPFWLLAALPVVLSTVLFVNTRAARADNRAATWQVKPAPATTPPAPALAPAEPGPATPPPSFAPVPATTPPPPAFAPGVTGPATPPPAPVPARATTPPPPAVAWAQSRSTTPAPAPIAPPAHRGEGYLAGLAGAGYTNISVDEIIDLKQNGVSPGFIKGMLQAGFGVLNPKELIKLKNDGVAPEYARSVKSSGIRDADVEGVIRLHQYGVRPELLEALGAAGYKDVTVAQAIQAQTNGLSGASLRSLREQGFKNLSLEQVLKLKRAGVI